ncbi:MAG: aconitase family protein [Pseudomonadota bacterium]
MKATILSAETEADVIVCPEGLSFWGGVDPGTGRVIDAHHALHGRSLAGKIVLMPTSRGSCSGSGVLLQLALNGRAPAALIFREVEEVLTLGALIAARMFDRTVGVVRLGATDYAALSGASRARLTEGSISFDGGEIPLTPVSRRELQLSSSDRAALDGTDGQAVALAMDVMCTMAAIQGAPRLIDVMRGHIDGCIYAHDANLIFAEAMAEMGARVTIPTTLNAISVERDRFADHALPPDFSEAARRLADAYVRMGARPSFTCAPYQSDAPEMEENIGWSESNAVIYANSVLGARTAKHPDYLDLFIAMTGRAPETGVYLTENRRPGLVIDVEIALGFDDALWPLLGWTAGHLAPDRIPRLDGLEATAPTQDDLRALCAAFGTTSAAPMLHVAGITPESDLAPSDTARAAITQADLREAWRTLNSGPEQVDLIALGSPHFSLEETYKFAEHLDGEHPSVPVIITLGRDVFARAKAEGLVKRLQHVGVLVHTDVCWCSMVEPMFPMAAKTLMTNSGKYAHYAPGLSGRAVRFGSLADCAKAATRGVAPLNVPEWLR